MNTPTMIPVIAIDGPTASGKGAVAQAVARGWAFTIWTVVPCTVWSPCRPCARGLRRRKPSWMSRMSNSWPMGECLGCALFGRKPFCWMARDVSQAIRRSTGDVASKIATVGALRQALLQRQRDFASARLGRGWARYGQCGLPRCFGKNLFDRPMRRIRAERRYKQINLTRVFLLI